MSEPTSWNHDTAYSTGGRLHVPRTVVVHSTDASIAYPTMVCLLRFKDVAHGAHGVESHTGIGGRNGRGRYGPGVGEHGFSVRGQRQVTQGTLQKSNRHRQMAVLCEYEQGQAGVEEEYPYKDRNNKAC